MIRQKVEMHAVDWARDFYERAGFQVAETGEPYDLRAVRGLEVVLVECKGVDD